VDSVLAEWHARLNAGFWGGLQKEFTAAGIAVAPFNDGPSFSSSVRQEVASLAASKQDPQPFVETLWKQKIDRDWRDGLTKDAMLGKTEYAALDKLVSELSRETIDMTFLAYIAGILVLAALIWFFRLQEEEAAGPPRTGTRPVTHRPDPGGITSLRGPRRSRSSARWPHCTRDRNQRDSGRTSCNRPTDDRAPSRHTPPLQTRRRSPRIVTS